MPASDPDSAGNSAYHRVNHSPRRQRGGYRFLEPDIFKVRRADHPVCDPRGLGGQLRERIPVGDRLCVADINYYPIYVPGFTGVNPLLSVGYPGSEQRDSGS